MESWKYKIGRRESKVSGLIMVVKVYVGLQLRLDAFLGI